MLEKYSVTSVGYKWSSGYPWGNKLPSQKVASLTVWYSFARQSLNWLDISVTVYLKDFLLYPSGLLSLFLSVRELATSITEVAAPCNRFEFPFLLYLSNWRIQEQTSTVFDIVLVVFLAISRVFWILPAYLKTYRMWKYLKPLYSSKR